MENIRETLLSNASETLKTFDADPKAQRCLEAYRGLSEEKQSVLMMALDAFARGMEIGRADALRAAATR